MNDQTQEPNPKGEGPMGERVKPQPRVRRAESHGNTVAATVECPFSHDDGWASVTVGWHEDQYPDGRGCWIAECSAQSGCYGDSETSQLHAMAELVRSLAGLCSVLIRRESDLHRAIHNSPDALAKELHEAESDLHAVQDYITTHIEPSPTDNWDAGLKPLWRAERAIEAFAARLAPPTSGSAPETP